MKITDDSTLNKLILLYVFEAMDVPLTGRTIIEMCSSRNLWLTYMDCMVAVNELLDSGLIYRSSKEKIVEKASFPTPTTTLRRTEDSAWTTFIRKFRPPCARK